MSSHVLRLGQRAAGSSRAGGPGAMTGPRAINEKTRAQLRDSAEDQVIPGPGVQRPAAGQRRCGQGRSPKPDCRRNLRAAPVSRMSMISVHVCFESADAFCRM